MSDLLKPVDHRSLLRAQREAKQDGEAYVVIYDSLLEEYRVTSRRAYRGCGMINDRRFDVRAYVDP